MAEPSERLSHPVLGELGWLPQYGHWFTQLFRPSGGRLDVVVDPGDEDRFGFLAQAAELFRWALDNERRVLADAMRAELLELYNGTWRQGGEPVLSARRLTARLGWALLTVSASETVPVEFGYDAGGLFGGHCVAVEVGAELRYRDVDLQ
jgi:hypothetical protein